MGRKDKDGGEEVRFVVLSCSRVFLQVSSGEGGSPAGAALWASLVAGSKTAKRSVIEGICF